MTKTVEIEMGVLSPCEIVEVIAELNEQLSNSGWQGTALQYVAGNSDYDQQIRMGDVLLWDAEGGESESVDAGMLRHFLLQEMNNVMVERYDAIDTLLSEDADEWEEDDIDLDGQDSQFDQ